MQNETYDKLKWIAIIFFPALSVLIKTIGSAVAWQYTDIAVLVINALAVFIGSFIGVSAKTYSLLTKDEEKE